MNKVNINIDLFKRYQPSKKYEMIKNLTISELFAIRPSTILRIIKEAGNGDSSKTRSKFKTLYLSNNPGNNWNSNVTLVYNGTKDALYISVYIQGYDTDTTVQCELKNLLISSDSTIKLGEFEETYLHDGTNNIQAKYNQHDRAEVIREILLQYIINKYNYEP